MKRCAACGQIVAQAISTCPACGNRLVAGMTHVDDYKIEKIIHEGRSSIVCRALKKGHQKPVTIRLFTDQSGVDTAIARRLEKELKILAGLPPDLFVQHYAIRQARTGHWYRVSEWVEADSWGSIFLSGLLSDQRRMVTLFHNIASALDLLHRHDHFMPYLILDDILLPRNQTRSLAVKINYKLSRFLNARATHHGPMLQKLLRVHPDIVNQRAIDFRTGIWSLGKIFIELLTADHTLTDFSARVDRLEHLDPELGLLIKVMLSDDPGLRPPSMAKVVSTLAGILERLPPKPLYDARPRKKTGLLREIIRLKRIVVLLVILLAGIVGANTFMAIKRSPPGETGLTDVLESHTRSVGFLMVEYWLSHQGRIIYRNKVEGTAFLVDAQGYMLTNRHVACPWLEDPALFQVRSRLVDKDLEFRHRMFLWFEGTKAFNRLQGLESSSDLADAYYLAGALRSTGKSRLRVAGVPRGVNPSGNRLHLPFLHDFAVLKTDTIPKGIQPLPLASVRDLVNLKRLSPVIIMGFPLGSRTQDERINASITRGHVRRTSRELIQVDSSIYKGNSGGPAVNSEGRVIGIASGVVTDQPSVQIPLMTPLSDFGLVLPIDAPARLVASLKAGQPKWDGILDFSLEKKLNQVLDLATRNDFNGAAGLAHKLMKTSQDPALVFTAALLGFCREDFQSSRRLFSRLISIEGENNTARLMLFIIDWLANSTQSRPLTRELSGLTWQHPDEFTGYLAKVLKSEQVMDTGFIDFENPAEKAWRSFIQGLILEKQGNSAGALAVHREVAMTAGANDPLYLMAMARFNRLMKEKQAVAKDKTAHGLALKADLAQALENRKKAKAAYNTAMGLIRKFESAETGHREKAAASDQLRELAPKNRTLMGRLAFYHASRSDWETALSLIDRYFATPARETALGLSLGLLKSQLLKLNGDAAAARSQLIRFRERSKNSWYGILARQLLQGPSEAGLLKLAANAPAKRLTLHTALGLYSEGNKNREQAAHHYREALGTYLDSRNEYDFARARLLRFRQAN